MTGINISFDYMNDARCRRLHDDERLVGVWVSTWKKSTPNSPMRYVDPDKSNIVFGVDGEHSLSEGQEMW